MAAFEPLTKLDQKRLRVFDGGGMTDGMHDRNFANRMEDLGFLEYTNGCMSGERFYDLTESGRLMLGETRGR